VDGELVAYRMSHTVSAFGPGFVWWIIGKIFGANLILAVMHCVLIQPLETSIEFNFRVSLDQTLKDFRHS
jgi:hypothetical protein